MGECVHAHGQLHRHTYINDNKPWGVGSTKELFGPVKENTDVVEIQSLKRFSSIALAVTSHL